MSLIKCPECKKDVSSNATTCPECEEPIKKSDEKKAKWRAINTKDPLRFFFFVVAVLLILGIILFVISSLA
jgi:predicted amidophosphoribosyltransferase